ncbi:hypothetical protein, conserved [Leishmania tarentolae]|uniref:Uncharacterized protein n=1 Tax=Leishmania tarentolae TaxID=5689 RepID=A0A640KS38_LEITA|nr:hypothetical protein, conserved [Leishmania tarentolae]
MRGTRLRRLQVSLAVRDSARITQIESLSRRWADLDAVGSAASTGLATKLLGETIACLQDYAPGPTSSSTSFLAAAPSSLSTPPPLLSSRESAQRIWRSLRRQRVPWQDALALLPWQLQAMTPAQRQFLNTHVVRTPARVTSLALAAWDVHDDAALVQRYRSLKRSTYMVEYARLISAALRERPSLPNGLLPVPYGVVEHGYALGRRSPQDAKIALALSKHMTLLGREALTREAEERLVLSHATLEGLAGRWQAALSIVQHNRAVRFSTREGVKNYVQSLLTREGDASLTTASEHGCAPATPGKDRAVSAEFALQVPLRCEGASTNWVKALHAFLLKESPAQTYPDARHLLESLPPEVRESRTYLLLASTVLHCCARRMFAGTLTRRVVNCITNANWVMALALTCAAQYYDVAEPLIPLATKGSKGDAASVLDVPPELREYVATVKRLKNEEGQAAAETSSLTETEAAALTYPEALAHALTASSPPTWRILLLFCPHTVPPTRLRYFLLAACGEDGDTTPVDRTSENRCAEDRIECSTFQTRAVSQLVCAAAEPRNQRYFFKVIPASTRAHHFERSPLEKAITRELGAGEGTGQRTPSAAAAAEADASQLLSNSAAGEATMSTSQAVSIILPRARLQAWGSRRATTPEECTQLLTDVSLYFRATHTVEGATISANERPRLTEEVFLKAMAALSSCGVVQLDSTKRFHWPLAVFKAARLLRVQVDASLMVATASTIPSIVVDRTRLVLPSLLGAHTLLGDWKAGLQLCMRLMRKQQNGEIEVDADTPLVGKPQTYRFTAPPPTLLEAMAQVGYASPAAVAVRHWKTLESLRVSTLASRQSDRSCGLSLLLLELQQFHDERQLCDEIRRLCASQCRGSPQQRLNVLSRRRMLVGSAFCLLESEAALRRVLRAAGKERARSTDVDSHGLQRLLRVVQSMDAAQVLAEEARSGRCAHEHWLCDVMSRADVAVEAADDLARLRPYSATLSALCFFKQAAAAHDAVGCLTGLLRLAERASECPYPDVLLLSLMRLLRLFLSNDALLSASVVTGEFAESRALSPALPRPTALALAYKVFNRMQEMQRLSLPLKRARRVWRRASDVHLPEGHASAGGTDTARRGKYPAAVCAVWALLGVLHSTVSSVLQVPVPACFTSSLLFRVVETDGAADWVTALLFFTNLRHPTMQERALLVRALRHCGSAATPILLSHRRFLRDCPEQAVIWADEASGQLKWLKSLAHLEHAQEVERCTTAFDAEAGNTIDSTASTRVPAPLLLPAVATIIRSWNAAERLRCGELLRRQGFIERGPTKKGAPLDDARVKKMADLRLQQRTEAILQLLKEKPPLAVPFMDAPPKLDSTNAGVTATRPDGD